LVQLKPAAGPKDGTPPSTKESDELGVLEGLDNGPALRALLYPVLCALLYPVHKTKRKQSELLG